jgi:hypothetical protein
MFFYLQRPIRWATDFHATVPIPVLFCLPGTVTTVKSRKNRETTANVVRGGVRQLYQQIDFPLKHEPKIELFHSHVPFYSSSKRSLSVRRDLGDGDFKPSSASSKSSASKTNKHAHCPGVGIFRPGVLWRFRAGDFSLSCLS